MAFPYWRAWRGGHQFGNDTAVGRPTAPTPRYSPRSAPTAVSLMSLKAKGPNGGRPPGFDPASYRHRNSIERGFNRFKTLTRNRHPLRQIRHDIPGMSNRAAAITYHRVRNQQTRPSWGPAGVTGAPSLSARRARRASRPSSRSSRPTDARCGSRRSIEFGRGSTTHRVDLTPPASMVLTMNVPQLLSTRS